MLFKKNIFFTLILLTTLSINVYAVVDVSLAAIINHSDKDWTVKFMMIKGHLGEHSDCLENQECPIKKHTTNFIIYQRDEAGELQGAVVVTDSQNPAVVTDPQKHRKGFYIDTYSSTLSLKALDDVCPNDISPDATGGFIINYPSLCWAGNL